MYTFRKRIAAVAVAASLGLATPALADNTTANINGSISANDYSQFKVTVKDPKTGYSRDVSINDNGSFRFAQLPTGDYLITVTKNGIVVAEDTARLTLGSNTSVAFDFLAEDGTERIEVTGGRISAVDLSSTDSGLVIDKFEVDRMPVAQNVTAIALLAPGTILGSANGFSAPNSGGLPSFGGSSVAENSCYINGMDVTNTSQGLGCGTVPFEFYKEFQVKTGGYSPQFGRATGGVINAVTKSGTNEWEFAASARFTPNSLKEDGYISYTAGGANGAQIFRNQTKDSFSKTEYTVSAGGPIIEDTLFVYALINPRDIENHFSSQTSGRFQYAPDNIYIKRDSSGSDNLFWGAKVDWLINDDHKISLFGYSNRSDTTSGSYNFDPETATIGDLTQTTVRKRGGEVKSISYVGNITDDLTVSAMYGEIETEYTNTPENLDCPSVVDNRSIPTSQKITSCGAGGTFGSNVDNNQQTRLDIEYAFDEHLFRVGLDRQVRDTFRDSHPITGHTWTYSTLSPNGSIQGNNGNLFTNNTNAPIDFVFDRIFDGGGGFTTDLTAWYAEDQWQITDNLMLNLGVRQDKFDNKGVTGLTFSSFKTDIAPRLGFSWDPTGNGDMKVYGTFGRYYLPVPNNTNFRAASGVSDITTNYLFTGHDSTGAATGLTPITGNLQSSQIINSVPNPAVQATFQSEEAEPFSKNELILGFESQVTDEFSYSVRGIMREIATALDDYCGPLASQSTCTLINPGSDATWALDNDGDSQVDPGSRRTYTAAEIGLPEATNDYTALQAQVKYNAENYRLSFVYSWSRSTGNFEGAVKSDIGQADAGITTDFDFPALLDGAGGYQANDRRHVFKFYGSMDVTDNLTLGFNSTLSSGRPLSAFGQGYPNHDPLVYGSYGDTFYLYTNQCPDTNGDGSCQQEEKEYQFLPRGSLGRTPWTFNIDVSANYTFKISDIDMRATLNVYNLLNANGVTSQNEHYENRRAEGQFNPYYQAAYTWQYPRFVELGFEVSF